MMRDNGIPQKRRKVDNGSNGGDGFESNFSSDGYLKSFLARKNTSDNNHPRSIGLHPSLQRLQRSNEGNAHLKPVRQRPEKLKEQMYEGNAHLQPVRQRPEKLKEPMYEGNAHLQPARQRPEKLQEQMYEENAHLQPARQRSEKLKEPIHIDDDDFAKNFAELYGVKKVPGNSHPKPIQSSLYSERPEGSRNLNIVRGFDDLFVIKKKPENSNPISKFFQPAVRRPEKSREPKDQRNFNKAEMASRCTSEKAAVNDVQKENISSLTANAMNAESSSTQLGGFQSASGSNEVSKEFKSITPLGSKKPEKSQTNSKVVQAALQKPDKPKDPNDLKNHESLKHFEEHIIEHIQAEILTSNNNVTWDAVAGLEQAKKTLREIVVFPFLRPDLFKGLRAPSKGVLLFGPPGTGKTLIAGCVANQAKATFFNVSVSTIMSKWVGEGEKVVRALFQIARLKLPSIIFIDEIDALLSARKDGDHESSRRVKTEFLIQMDGIATNSDERLLILGATNKPEDIDEAARRRFPKRLYIALPDFEARKGMIQRHMRNNLNELEDADYAKLADMTDGFSGADIFHFAKEAAYCPLRDVIDDIEKIPEDRIRAIKFEDFTKVLTTVKPTVLKNEMDSFLEWDKKFGSHSVQL